MFKSPVLIGAIVATAYLLYGIFTSTNSTAAIGFLFAPLYALAGACIGGLLEHVYLLVQKRRELISRLSGFYLAVIVVLTLFVTNKIIEKKDLEAASNPETPVSELRALMDKKDSSIRRLLFANPSFPVEEVRNTFSERKSQYDVAADIIDGPHLEAAMIHEMVQMMPDNFPSKTEYELYQTYVWAPLVRNKKLTSTQIHILAAKPNPEHFLILALLNSNELTCEEKRSFLPQQNDVLSSAIESSLTGCP